MTESARTRLLPLLTALASLALASTSLAQTQTPSSGFAPTARKGVFTVFNQSFDSARVEVSIGTSRTCPQGAAVRRIALPKGRAWSLRSAVALCYRFDSSPDARQPQWSAWQLRVLTKQAATADSI